MLKFAVDVKYGIKSSWQAAGPARGKWLNNKKKKMSSMIEILLKPCSFTPFVC